jgi:lia operon protein LiaG
MSRHFTLASAVALLATLPAVVSAQERYGIGADRVAIYNLAGAVEVVGTSGGQVTVDVTRGGREGDRLRIESGRVGDVHALRVIYPTDRVVYSDRGRTGTTSLTVRRDGTWGGRAGLFGGGGNTVRISGSGRGTDAHADLRVGVPHGQRVSIYLAVGTITAENVDGVVRLDTHSGAVTAQRMSGDLTIDTGSGPVSVAGMQGRLLVDTGSGSVRISDVAGDEVRVDTGSGAVAAESVSAGRIVIDTGSGGIELRRSSGRDVRLDTGSGSVIAELSGQLDKLVVDTGSGGVTLALPRELGARLAIDTGSGGIHVDYPLDVTRRGRSELHGVIGSGAGSIVVDTGSGSVRIRPLQP